MRLAYVRCQTHQVHAGPLILACWVVHCQSADDLKLTLATVHRVN